VVKIEERRPGEDAVQTILEVQEKDLKDLRSALSWKTGQDNVPQPRIISRNGDTAEVSFSGELIPRPSPEDIIQIISDYKLLSNHYGSFWMALRRSPKWSEPLDDQLFLDLASLIQGIKDVLKDLGSTEMNKRVKDLPDLPDWCLRVLEIRKESKGESA
jgi:hypothetical protein